MKKTILALVITASTASSIAHAAWMPIVNEMVNIGGIIYPDQYQNNWEWETGTDLDNYTNVISDLQDHKVLTVTVAGNKPILRGRTVNAFAIANVGGNGAIPQIRYMDSTGKPINFTWSTDHSGKGSFTLPMSDATTNETLGKAVVNITYAAVRGVGGGTDIPDESGVTSVASDRSTGIFYGGTPGTKDSALIQSGDAAASMTALFGSLSKADLISQINKAVPSANITTLKSLDKPHAENMNYTDGNVVSAAYALGIANGQKIVATFDKPVTTYTKWKAPVTVEVSYN